MTHSPNEIMIKRIKQKMAEKGINARQLAKLSGVGDSFVYDILNGKSKNPTSSKLNLISRELGVSIAYLMNMETDDLSYNKYLPVYNFENEREPRILFSKAFCVEKFISSKSLYVYRMTDDSMAFTICHNDILIVDKLQNNISHSGLFVIRDSITTTVRRLEHIIGSTKLRIMPDNDKYNVFINELKDIEILGKVVLIVKEM